MFQSGLDTQYLLITVMLILAIQYAAMEIGGLFVIDATGIGIEPWCEDDLLGGDGEPSGIFML
jgi:hypothetical protein